MKKLLGMLMLALVVTGCSGGGEKTTTVCKGNIDELTTNTTTIEATDDKVSTMKATIEYDVTSLVSDTTTIEYLESYVKSMNVDYGSLDGVTAKYTTEGTIITLEVEINYEEADMEQLADAGVITSTDGKEIAYISLDETIKEQEAAGLTCK
ncbi:DUF1307 domain-containing protein [Thomasclavelia sp.]|uniref:DUF1307 domain-containing protein n=1 Tax=Thomasclavelia sp. TaxID=3025757 RepID=UPI0025E69402|nr:DUF1307 domain-containing protein [Thomasclavelia sp.]